MAKNIVLLSDGTGNSAAKIWKTNVWRLYQSLDLADSKKQIALYDDGVGTSSFKPLAILGGALGYGLKRNVIELYSFLSRNYQPGDRIYGFGFSRGAYTIRVLAAMVINEGLVRSAKEGEIYGEAKESYRAYRRSRYKPRHLIVSPLRSVRDLAVSAGETAVEIPRRILSKVEAEEADGRYRPDIHFLGLWDTVEAYGLPIEEMKRGVDIYFWPLSFPDRKLSPKVKRACHALSLDDERLTFHPVLWTEKGEKSASHIKDERISQVWFAGVHANVGGGYPDDGLAHVPLNWIMEEAERLGLKFKPEARADIKRAAKKCRLNLTLDPKAERKSAAVALGRLYDSRRGLSGYYRYAPRKLKVLTNDTFNDVKISLPKIHETVFKRIKSGTDDYAPIGLPEHYAVVHENGAIQRGKNNPFEHPSQSESRAHEQEKVWNIVWWRRLFYFLTLAASAYLALFPLIHPPARDGACSSQFCFMSRPIEWIGSLLPGFLSPWIDTFKSHPGKFSLGVLMLVLLLRAGATLRGKIMSRMRGLWSPIISSRPQQVEPASVPCDALYRIRTSWPYELIHRHLRRNILPTIFALLFLYVGLAVINRTIFSVANSWGYVCREGDTEVIENQLVTKTGFLTREVCWATGVQVRAGARYFLSIQIDTALPWSDGSIKTDLGGFGFDEAPAVLWPALAIRRKLGENWFKPIARIGATGTDEYVLEPDDGLVGAEAARTIATSFTARTDGELFLYVNDAVLFWPWEKTLFSFFYENNLGSANITIWRIIATRREPAAK